MDFESRYQRYRSFGFDEAEARRLANADVAQAAPRSLEPEEDLDPGFGTGIGVGLKEFGASATGALGYLAGGVGKRLGLGDIGRGAKEYAERVKEESPELTGKAAWGRTIGRLAPELALSFTGGSLALRGASKVPGIAQALSSGSRVRRALATGAASLPVDFAQAAMYQEGAVLPGFGGALAENIGLSGLAGGILPAVKPSSRAAAVFEAEEASDELARAAREFDERVSAGPQTGPELFPEEIQIRPPVGATPEEVAVYGKQRPMSSLEDMITGRLSRAAEQGAERRAIPEIVTAEPEEGIYLAGYRRRSRQKQSARLRQIQQAREASEAAAERQRRAGPSEEASLRLEEAAEAGARERAGTQSDGGLILFSGFPIASLDAFRSEGAQAALSAGLGAAVGGAAAGEDGALGGVLAGGLAGALAPSLIRRAVRAGGKVSVEDVREAANEQAANIYKRSRPVVNVTKEGPIPTIQREIGEEASREYTERYGKREPMRLSDARRETTARDAEQAVAKFYAGEKLDAVDTMALQQQLKSVSNEWGYITDQADKLEKMGNSKAAQQLLDASSETFERLMRYSYAGSGELTEAARKMRFQQDVFGVLGELSPSQYMTVVKNAMGVREIKASLREELGNIISIADKAKRERLLTEFAQRNAKTSLLDLIMDIRKAGLLSRPASWIRNFVGSGEGLVGEVTETPMARVIDRVMSAATGQERVFGDMGIVDRLATASKGWGEGARSVWKNKSMFIDGVNPEDPLSMLGRRLINYERAVGEGAPAPVRGAARALQKANNFVYGLIAGGDQPFYQAALNTSIKERALIRVLDAPQVRNGSIKIGSDEFNDLLRAAIDPATANADDVVMATFDALDATYKTSTFLAEQIQTAKRRGGATGRVMEFLIPFPNTPTNIVRKALERVPGLGLVMGTQDKARLLNHVERMRKSGYEVTDEAITNQLRRLKTKLYAKQITGSTAVFMGYAMHKNGILTTEYVSPIGASDVEREQLAKRGVTGEGPLSLKIGKNSYSLASLGTIAPLLALGAALSAAETKDDEVSTLDKISTPLSAVGRTILEMPLLTGAREAIETLEGRGIAKPAQAGRQLASFIPLSGGLTGIARALDVESGSRRPETFAEGFVSGMPFLSEGAAPRVTALGERIRPAEDVFGFIPAAQEILQPFTPRRVVSGPIYDILEDIGYYPSAPRKLEGESEAEYSARREQEGVTEREVLERVLASALQSPRFSEEQLATNEVAREQLADVVRKTLATIRRENTLRREAQQMSGARAR